MLTVQADLNIFTLYSFLNTVGYDDENNKSGMHPQRIQIRNNLFKIAEDLDTSDFKSYFQTYYLENKVHLFHFNTYALSLSKDTDFKLVNTNYSTSLLPNLNSILKDFYSKFGIKALWERMAESHNIISAKYNEVSENIVNIAQSYFSEKPDSKITITVVPNLLESYFRNKSILIENDLYLLFGPYKNNGANTEGISHEYLHLLVNPIIDKYNKEINAFCIFISFKKIHSFTSCLALAAIKSTLACLFSFIAFELNLRISTNHCSLFSK